MAEDLTSLLCDPARLAPWLDAQGLAPGLPLVVDRITTGHSNETFLVRRGDREWILRRPPRVPLAPTRQICNHREMPAVALTSSRGGPPWAVAVLFTRALNAYNDAQTEIIMLHGACARI